MAIVSPLEVDSSNFDGGMIYGVFFNTLLLQWALLLSAPLAVAGFLLSLPLFLARHVLSWPKLGLQSKFHDPGTFGGFRKRRQTDKQT